MITDSHDGHRGRLRDKYLKAGISGFHDYEIVELLLTLGTPRRDCKTQAKEVLKKFKCLRGVLEASTVSLIFAHNHPSGAPKPSRNDKKITENLVAACQLMQLKVLDHIIVGDNRYFSFADEGLV